MNLLALIGIFDIIGTIASGWLTDRFDPRFLLVGYYFFRGIGLPLPSVWVVCAIGTIVSQSSSSCRGRRAPASSWMTGVRGHEQLTAADTTR